MEGHFLESSMKNQGKLLKVKNISLRLWVAEGQESISSTFYERVFCTKFWDQKLQSCVLGLKFFGTKFLCEKGARKTLMKNTAGVTV